MEILNFNAGPSYLDEDVRSKSQAFISKNGLELSHRGKEITKLFQESKELIQELMHLNNDYEILFLHGGARLQNSLIPYNINVDKRAYYLDTGAWSMKSYQEASIIRECSILASSAKSGYSYIPKQTGWEKISEAGYLHLTTNNTVHGSQIFDFSEYQKGTIIADMSSDILSRELDYTQFGLIYAGLQKNLGTAGGSIVVINKNLIDYNLKLPSMLSYAEHVKAGSMLNTPPVFAVKVSNLVMNWIISKGGINAIEKANRQKSELLYNEIDRNDLFECYVKKEDRSLMNATFKLTNKDVEKKFNEYLDNNGVIGYKGHRSKGGYRISMYNMMPLEKVERFIRLLQKFKG